MNPNHIANPFLPGNERAYRYWRERKLAAFPRTAAEISVGLGDPAAPTAAEIDAVLGCCCRANMAIYTVTGPAEIDKSALRSLGRKFGLRRLDHNLRADEDSITSLRVVPAGERTHYIPYTNRALNWHTDGYYNPAAEQVRGVAMHCVSPAARGGENRFLDHEIAYLLLRDENPAYITALMQADAMVIPANIEDGVEIRPAQAGPVFSIEPRSGALHMRYTARTRSIAWKDDRVTRLATGFLAELLAGDTQYTLTHRLAAGQGVICNNVLHRREAFVDDAASGRRRLLYRARYHERVRDTGISRCPGEAACSG